MSERNTVLIGVRMDLDCELRTPWRICCFLISRLLEINKFISPGHSYRHTRGTPLTCSSNLAPCAKSARASGQGKCQIASCVLGSGLETRQSLLQTSSLEAGT